MDTALITHCTSSRVTTATWRDRTTTVVEPRGLEDVAAHAALLEALGVDVTVVVAP